MSQNKASGGGGFKCLSFSTSSPSILFLPHPSLFLSSRVPIAGYPDITIIIPFKVAWLDLFILSPTIYFLF